MKNYKVFDAFKTNSAGIWFFAPAEGEFKNGRPCKGFGIIKYAEGSVYSGDIYYDGKNFNKIGYGQQNFTQSGIGDLIPEIREKKYMFAGRYDYRKTDWVYGDGVLYYTDENGKPSHFKKGFFKGLKKIGEYSGNFDYSALAEGYTADMEFDYDEDAGVLDKRWQAISSKLSAAQQPYTLFIGDSYFELFDNPEFAGENLLSECFGDGFVNAGVCGSKFSDWLDWADRLKEAPAPEKIVINLGFNDLHSGASVNKTFSNGKKLISVLRGYFPDAEIYLTSVVHAPNCANFLEKEREYNAKLATAAVKNGFHAGGWNDGIAASGQNCFHSDAIHPNERGYRLFAEFLKEFLK